MAVARVIQNRYVGVRPMRVLVTGASGMLGRSVAETILGNAHTVTVMQRRPSGLACAEILGDIANYTDIAPVVQVSEVVVERSDG